LAVLLAKSSERPKAVVLFYYPSGEEERWARTDLWASADSIPGVHSIGDRDGTAAGQFGARTSGQVLLYDANGQLLFSGGITASRGHEGRNEGSDSLLALLSGEEASSRSTRVFGCSLVTPR
jgi:hypothetical protein